MMDTNKDAYETAQNNKKSKSILQTECLFNKRIEDCGSGTKQNKSPAKNNRRGIVPQIEDFALNWTVEDNGSTCAVYSNDGTSQSESSLPMVFADEQVPVSPFHMQCK